MNARSSSEISEAFDNFIGGLFIFPQESDKSYELPRLADNNNRIRESFSPLKSSKAVPPSEHRYLGLYKACFLLTIDTLVNID